MAGIMERVFGRRQESMPLQQPQANPEAIAAQPQQEAKPALPLDNFKDVWETPANSNEADPFASPLLTVDPAKVSEAVGKMDFLSGMQPELLTKATSGDVQAFGQVINTVVQKAMAAQVQLAGQMTEGAISKNNERFNTSLPKRIREAQVNDVRSSNSVLQHKAAAPMLDTLKRQFMSKHPDKSPQQIHDMAEEMLTTFANQLVSSNTEKSTPKERDPQDFSNWL